MKNVEKRDWFYDEVDKALAEKDLVHAINLASSGYLNPTLAETKAFTCYVMKGLLKFPKKRVMDALVTSAKMWVDDFLDQFKEIGCYTVWVKDQMVRVIAYLAEMADAMYGQYTNEASLTVSHDAMEYFIDKWPDGMKIPMTDVIDDLYDAVR